VTVAVEGTAAGRWATAHSWLARHRTAALALLFAWLTWPLGGIVPCGALDCSWRFALHESFRSYWSGTRVTVFTYGPLGFLVAPQLWSRVTAVVAVVVLFVVQALLAGFLLDRLTRFMSLVPAVVATYFVLRIQGDNVGESADLVVLLIAVSLMRSERKRPRAWLLLMSVASGALLLVKFSGGVLACALSVITALFLEPEQGFVPERLRVAVPSWVARLASGAIMGATSLATMTVAFVCVTGQPLRLVGWLRGSLSVASGYGAMAIEQSPPREYVLAFVLVGGLVTLGLVSLRRHAADLGVAAALAVVAYLKFREGFERHDSGHTLLFASALALFPWLLLQPEFRRGALPVAAALSAFAVWMSVNVGAGAPRDLFQLYDGPRAAITQLHQLSTGSQSASVQLAAKAAIRAQLAVPDQVLRAIGNRSVDVTPWDTAVVWAYGLRWKPVDVWALYSSYTPALDHADALSVSRGYGPDVLLRHLSDTSIDGRFSGFESPEFQLTLTCSWHRLAVAGGWELLGRGRSRCGSPSRLGDVRVVPGQAVAVPRSVSPGSLVVARVTLHEPLSERLRTMLFKPSGDTYLALDGQKFRFVTATGPDGLVLVSPAGLPFPGGAAHAAAKQLVLSGPFTSADVAFSEIPISAAA
jgi:hypothetical protein